MKTYLIGSDKNVLWNKRLESFGGPRYFVYPCGINSMAKRERWERKGYNVWGKNLEVEQVETTKKY